MKSSKTIQKKLQRKLTNSLSLKKDSIKEQLLEEIRGYITPVPKHYEWTRGYCPYDDSGEIYVNGLVSLDQTIAEFLENEYTGQRRATFISHQGFDYETYGDQISYLLKEIKENIVQKTVKKYVEELFGEEISEDDLFRIFEEYYSEIYAESIAFDFDFYEDAVKFTGIKNMKLSELVEK